MIIVNLIREIRTESIETFTQGALKAVHFEEADLSQLNTDIGGSKKWILAFGVDVSSSENNPLLNSLLKDYKECMSKEMVRERAARQKANFLSGRL